MDEPAYYKAYKDLTFYMGDKSNDELMALIREACRPRTDWWRAYEQLHSRLIQSEKRVVPWIVAVAALSALALKARAAENDGPTLHALRDRIIKVLTGYDPLQSDAWKAGYWGGIRKFGLPMVLAAAALLYAFASLLAWARP